MASSPTTITTTLITTATTTNLLDRDKTLQDELGLPILLTDRLIKSVSEAESNRSECAEIARQADELSQKLRSAVRLTTASSSSTLYDRPIRRIAADVSKNLERALSLVRKCKHSNLFRHVFLTITSSAADFRKVSSLLQSSIADFSCLLSLYNDEYDDDDGGGGGANLSLPPIVSNDPIFALVWSSIASLQTNRRLKDRIDSANYLAELARQNQRFRKVIVEEGAVLPLLKLLKDTGGGGGGGGSGGGASTEGQIAAAKALFWLVDEKERTRIVAAEGGIPVIVQVFGEACMSVQVVIAELVAELAKNDPIAREEFGKENVLKILISCLIVDVDMEEYKLKINCALALWRLCDGSVLNSQKIAEPKGLFCLSKIIELQFNCLMTILKVAEVAEENAELRKVAWKPISRPAKAVLDQLLRVIKEESSSNFQIPVIKAIGCLARIFPAKETGIVSSLVGQLRSKDVSVAMEAAIALAKFACPDNHNCVAHSKTIIEFNGAPPLMRLLSMSEPARKHGLVLLCYLSMHVGNSKEARALRTLESAVRSGIAQTSELKEIFSRAVHQLMLYHEGSHPHNHPYTMV